MSVTIKRHDLITTLHNSGVCDIPFHCRFAYLLHRSYEGCLAIGRPQCLPVALVAVVLVGAMVKWLFLELYASRAVLKNVLRRPAPGPDRAARSVNEDRPFDDPRVVRRTESAPLTRGAAVELSKRALLGIPRSHKSTAGTGVPEISGKFTVRDLLKAAPKLVFGTPRAPRSRRRPRARTERMRHCNPPSGLQTDADVNNWFIFKCVHRPCKCLTPVPLPGSRVLRVKASRSRPRAGGVLDRSYRSVSVVPLVPASPSLKFNKEVSTKSMARRPEPHLRTGMSWVLFRPRLRYEPYARCLKQYGECGGTPSCGAGRPSLTRRHVETVLYVPPKDARSDDSELTEDRSERVRRKGRLRESVLGGIGDVPKKDRRAYATP
ncbi:hypothetical protein EVAR_30402_1 [Eumeta japonica]|uniref:Uncharacterized protein n=1 Tax=Eumeta variegata TaxID=151549 RepID=A0A4C1W5I7_EUMVA|nr:hypothetical protein EVAR_30402_1 [Eumeta japonica]